MPEDVKSSHTYEFAHENTIIEVTAKYIGKNSIIDVIKAAIKRDFELFYDEMENVKSEKILD